VRGRYAPFLALEEFSEILPRREDNARGLRRCLFALVGRGPSCLDFRGRADDRLDIDSDRIRAMPAVQNAVRLFLGLTLSLGLFLVLLAPLPPLLCESCRPFIDIARGSVRVGRLAAALRRRWVVEFA
jgi:hypothetical protein